MKRQDAARKESSSSGGGDYIEYVKLRDDGDMVLFRPVTDSDPEFAEKSGAHHVFIKGEFHSVPGTSSRGVDFWKDVLCGSRFDEAKDDWVGECDLCKKEIRRRTQFYAWVYVYANYFRAQDPRYIPGDSNTDKFKRKQVRRGQDIFYKQDVNKYCIWQDGYFMLELLKGKIGQFGTLCDRDYIVIRHGVRKNQNTQRELEAQERSPMSPEIMEGSAELPSLYDVALGKTRKYGGGSATQEVPDEVNLADIPEDSMPSVEGFESTPESEALFDELAASTDEVPSDEDFDAIFDEGPGVGGLNFEDDVDFDNVTPLVVGDEDVVTEPEESPVAKVKAKKGKAEEKVDAEG